MENYRHRTIDPGAGKAGRWLLGIFFCLPAVCPAPGLASEPAAPGPAQAADTAYVAAGYVEDLVCADCHAELFDAYQEVGMARSFARPQRAEPIEDFDQPPFYHRASDRYYQMRRSSDGGMVMARWQRGEQGQPVSQIEQRVDWVLGSGHTSRVYLYRTPSGELFQLPLAWYSQGQGWGMAPGFDRPVHEGLSRRVRRECMFCHNAYPDVSPGSDRYGAPQTFPRELPEGTGCQRCHGPGAEHVARFMDGGHDVEAIRAAIVNPGRLSPQRRNQVCNSCHLQPTVELMGVRRFGRAEYSHRPGEDLAEYLVLLDAKASDQERGERFEINHHPYRLEQSRCFQASADLSCLTCHDPHRKVPVAERSAHYRSACLGCHQVDACGAQHAGHADQADIELGNCVGCHMPRRRTQDVVHVAMTDHRIQKPAPGRDWLAPLEERDPVLVDVDFLRPRSAPPGAEGQVYRTAAVLRAGGGAEVAGRLEKLLEATASAELAPWLDLARARVQQRQWPEARRALARLAELMPERHPARSSLLGYRAMVAAGAADTSDDTEQAVALFRQALELHEDPTLLYNLGVVLAGRQRLEEAELHLRRSVELRPNALAPLFYLARVENARGRHSAAEAWAQRSLAVDPGHGDSYLLLARLLAGSGRLASARAVLRRGLILARGDTADLRAALERLKTPADAP